MGNIHSNNINNENCLICWDEIDHIELVECTQCKIYMHSYCEEIFRGGKGSCKCPHCQSIGTLSIKN